MAATTPNKILLKTNDRDALSRPIKDAIAGGTITPGDMVEEYLDSGTLKVRRVSAADSALAGRMVALENIYNKDNQVKAIDANYSAGDNVRYVLLNAGDEFLANLELNDATTYGEALTCSNVGQVHDAPATATDIVANSIVGFALEALSASASVVQRVKIRAA